MGKRVLPPVAVGGQDGEDEDVTAEHARVSGGAANSDVLQVCRLSKVYQYLNKKVHAVNRVSLGIPAGEVSSFCLLCLFEAAGSDPFMSDPRVKVLKGSCVVVRLLITMLFNSAVTSARNVCFPAKSLAGVYYPLFISQYSPTTSYALQATPMLGKHWFKIFLPFDTVPIE